MHCLGRMGEGRDTVCIVPVGWERGDRLIFCLFGMGERRDTAYIVSVGWEREGINP